MPPILYIKALTQKTKGQIPVSIEKKNFSVVSSYTHAVEFGKEPILIGERINPTGKKKLKEALKTNDIDYVLKEGVLQQEKGVHMLYFCLFLIVPTKIVFSFYRYVFGF